MNKELFIVFLFLSLLMLLSNDKEGLRNPLVPPEYEFSILTAPQEVMSGYFQEELCRNDGEWSSGDKTCNDILNKDDCSLVGLNGVSANDACLISCDTCPSSVTIKQREPMPIGEDTDLSSRGINFEDNDDYDYMEIYDAFEQIDDDLQVIEDKLYAFLKKHPAQHHICPAECLSSSPTPAPASCPPACVTVPCPPECSSSSPTPAPASCPSACVTVPCPPECLSSSPTPAPASCPPSCP